VARRRAPPRRRRACSRACPWRPARRSWGHEHAGVPPGDSRRVGFPLFAFPVKDAAMKKMKLVMIGNGMAGVRTLEELLKIAPDLYDIAVFGAEPHANYNRILLSPVLAGEMTIKDIMLNDVGWYGKNNISLHLGKKGV